MRTNYYNRNYFITNQNTSYYKKIINSYKLHIVKYNKIKYISNNYSSKDINNLNL